MKAVRFHEYGGPSVLVYEDVEQPTPGPGEVLIRVAATTYNPLDAAIRAGYLREVFPTSLPHVPGFDVAGTVDAVGPDVTGPTIGAQVIGFLPVVTDGASADYVVAPAEILASPPTTIPLTDAAALPTAALTAWQALFTDADIQAGQRLLVNGAGGAVGAFALQLAKRVDAHVIATASPRSVERVRAAGADEIIDHTTTSVATSVSEPVDVLLNLAPPAPAELSALIALVRPGGVVLSTTTPPVADNADGVRAVHVFALSDAARLAELVGLVDAGELRIDIADRLPLEQLPALHGQADAGELPGKVVILPTAV